MSDSIDKILEAKKVTKLQVASNSQTDDKFFSIPRNDGTTEESFLELKHRDGLRNCLPYSSMQWFALYPEDGRIDLDFGFVLVRIMGRGLGGRLFDGLRSKRVAYVKESDSEMQDNKDNETFVESISYITEEQGDEEQKGEE
ncbi:MAG: hypothetical protein QM796_20610 [Chthoniobacteraceae bacterium]